MQHVVRWRSYAVGAPQRAIVIAAFSVLLSAAAPPPACPSDTIASAGTVLCVPQISETEQEQIKPDSTGVVTGTVGDGRTAECIATCGANGQFALAPSPECEITLADGTTQGVPQTLSHTCPSKSSIAIRILYQIKADRDLFVRETVKDPKTGVEEIKPVAGEDDLAAKLCVLALYGLEKEIDGGICGAEAGAEWSDFLTGDRMPERLNNLNVDISVEINVTTAFPMDRYPAMCCVPKKVLQPNDAAETIVL